MDINFSDMRKGYRLRDNNFEMFRKNQNKNSFSFNFPSNSQSGKKKSEIFQKQHKKNI